MALTSSVSLTVSGKLTSTSGLLPVVSDFTKNYAASLASGVLAGQADRMYAANRTIAASGVDDLDLAGVLLDISGVAIPYARVKALIVAAAAANTNNVVVGAAATNAFATMFGAVTHTLVLRPGTTQALFTGIGDLTGYVVTAGTGDILRVANSGAGSTVNYDVVILGASS